MLRAIGASLTDGNGEEVLYGDPTDSMPAPPVMEGIVASILPPAAHGGSIIRRIRQPSRE